MAIEAKTPDGGWGWAVVFGSFVAQALTAGEAVCMGLFLLEWLEEFQVSVSSASWIISIMPLLVGFLSPVSSVVGARFGHRPISCIGAVVMALGSICSAFVTSSTQLFFTSSFLIGFGSGLIYAPSSVMVGIYFKKRFVLANTIATSGAIFGQIASPPFFAYLISAYGWRGALIIVGAFDLNMLVCACLYRPLVTNANHRKTKSTNTITDNFKLYYVTNEDANLSANALNEDNSLTTNITNEDDISANPSKTKIMNEDSEQVELQDHDDCEGVKTVTSSLHMFTAISKAAGIPELCYTIHFPVVLLAALVMGINIYCYAIYTPLRASEYGFSKNQSALMLSFIGIGSLLGRVVNTVIVGCKYARIESIFTIGFAAVGIMLIVTPLLTGFIFLLLSASAYGVSLGIATTLMFPIARAVSPARLLAPVIGFVILFFAFGNWFGTFLGGWLHDLTGNFDTPLFTCGAATIVTTILLLPTVRWLRSKNEEIQ